jgi:hypothetical protein
VSESAVSAKPLLLYGLARNRRSPKRPCEPRPSGVHPEESEVEKDAVGFIFGVLKELTREGLWERRLQGERCSQEKRRITVGELQKRCCTLSFCRSYYDHESDFSSQVA